MALGRWLGQLLVASPARCHRPGGGEVMWWISTRVTLAGVRAVVCRPKRRRISGGVHVNAQLDGRLKPRVARYDLFGGFGYKELLPGEQLRNASESHLQL